MYDDNESGRIVDYLNDYYTNNCVLCDNIKKCDPGLPDRISIIKINSCHKIDRSKTLTDNEKS